MPFDPDKFSAQPSQEAAPATAIPPAISGFDPAKFSPGQGQPGAAPIIGNLPPRTPEKPEQRTIPERLGQGFMDPIYGAAQLGARMSGMPEEGGLAPPMPPEERDKMIGAIDDMVRKRASGISQRAGSGTDWWRLVGQAGNPMVYAPALAGGLVGAAASGMAAAALQPQEDTHDFYEKKLKDVALGGAFGTAGGAVANVAGRTVSPVVGRAAQELMARGVELTPGRLAGQLMSRMEDAARSVPALGWFIRNAADRSNRTFNTAAVNAALDPIGVVMPSQVPAGRPAVEFLGDKLSDAYNSVLNLPGVQLVPDPPFLQEMGSLMQRAQGLGTQLENNYSRKINQAVGMRLLGGQMSGQELKAAESELGALAKRYSTSALASERDLGDVFRDAQHSIRDALQRQNPQVAGELGSINQSYAMFKRIQAASSRRAGAGKDEGVFTPLDLATAVKSKDPTKDKAAFSRGDAIMQDFAEWGLFVMPQRVPDSGTTERAMWAMLGLGAGTVGVGPAAAMMAKGMVAATPYLGPVTRGLNRYAQPGAIRQGVRGGIETATPAVGVPAGVAAQRYDQSGNPVDASR